MVNLLIFSIKNVISISPLLDWIQNWRLTRVFVSLYNIQNMHFLFPFCLINFHSGTLNVSSKTLVVYVAIPNRIQEVNVKMKGY